MGGGGRDRTGGGMGGVRRQEGEGEDGRDRIGGRDRTGGIG